MTTYTLRQVRPLLTPDELSLFQDSRRQSIGQLSVQQLRKAIDRSRSLRDKYRDLYRCQTVETRTSRTAEGKTARSQHGGENARTQLKSDVLADVLQRFQLRLDKVTETAGKVMGKKSGAKRKQTRQAAADDSPAMDIETLKQDVRDALAASREAHDNPLHDAMEQHTDISGKASAQAHGAMPTDIQPAALRQNVLKQDPVNMKIHASARGRGKAYQAHSDKRGEDNS